MPLIPDPAAFRARIAALPVVSYEIGETAIAGGTTSGRLLVLKKGAVEVLKNGVRLAEVSEPGVIFGELSLLLDRPHTADVRALQYTEFTSPMRRTCSTTIRPPYSMSPCSWRGVLMLPTKR